jgi:PAS domain S-box-containing protein
MITCPSTPTPETEAEKVKQGRGDRKYGGGSSGANAGASEASEEIQGVWEERETRYLQIVEDQTDPVARFQPDGNLTFVNRAYCRFFNKTDEELIGNGFFDSITDEQALELRGRMTLLAPGCPHLCEHEITITPAECRWVNWTFQGILDTEGKLVEIQSVARDVTDRRRAEIALKKSEARYSNLIKAIPDGVVAYDPQGNATYANDGFVQLYGWSQEEVLGRSINFVPPEEEQRTRAAWQKTFEGEKVLLETRRMTKEGHLL